MMWLKGCPRCEGDLFEELAVGPEAYGSHFVNCLQCGHTLTEEETTRLPRAERPAPSASAWRRVLTAARA